MEFLHALIKLNNLKGLSDKGASTVYLTGVPERTVSSCSFCLLHPTMSFSLLES